ncbi:MAG: hypothetical protein KDI46_08550 [Alphaproteobacteria bacterium]|nr:hypothetical protein [Alphaproteobacteria bacterium]
MSKRFFLFFLSALLLSAPVFQAFPAYAQDKAEEDDDFVNQYDPKYRPQPGVPGMNKNEDEIYESSTLITNGQLKVDIVRPEHSEPGELAFLIHFPGAFSGCMDLTDPVIESKTLGRIMRIEIKPPRLNVERNYTEYSQHACEVKRAAAQAEYVFTRDDLLQNNINKIQLIIKHRGPLLDYDVKPGEERVLFTAKLTDLMRLGLPYKNGVNKQEFWFYPKNTLVLYNSGLDFGKEETGRKIAEMARAKGLVPLTDIYPEFRTTKENRNKMYFVDQGGVYAAQLATHGTVNIGSIQLGEMYYGPEGPEERRINKPVYARVPGARE